ncbi:hypothetical protein DSO57_1027725 [Entomophthora muscae]|uniref:Uncharacterized protein n=1 Tax=Entomophthora muscae TaxID=34485 RepID=A0ACC2SR37_9FUNG|nr:hypothetical protein DSO57_1027725 [Entomophthora muscae]
MITQTLRISLARFGALSRNCSINSLKAQALISASKISYRNLSVSHICSSEAATQETEKPKETIPEPKIGNATKYEFKTETNRLLDIVANSLYSEKEVFIRELISNACDATEKLRHRQLAEPDNVETTDSPQEIILTVDKDNNTFTIQDFGIGLTEQELHENLGTIARSGSKKFVEQLKGAEQASSAKDKIIGQFGVGFYSAFMVGRPIQVFTRSSTKGSKGYCWTSDGQGAYEIAEAENVQIGTRIVIHLHDKSFVSKAKVKEVVKKYSNFVNFPIRLNDEIINEIEPLWTKDKNKISEDDHTKFFQFVSDSYDTPRFSLVYKTDAPLTIRSILYIPRSAGDIFTRQEKRGGLHLYSRNVMIQNKVELLPHWLRFVQGVVDSEDIPLNLSREILQNGRLIQSLSRVLTDRVLRWLKDEAKRDPKEFSQFYSNFHQYFKEGVIMNSNDAEKASVTKLLRFSSSATTSGEMTTLDEYIGRMKPEQKSIYYLGCPRADIDSSPYYEPFKKAGVEVLALTDSLDKVLITSIGTFEGKRLVDLESTEAANELAALCPETDVSADRLTDEQARALGDWILEKVGSKLCTPKIEISKRQASFPALVVDHHQQNDPYMREILRHQLGMGEKLPGIPATVEINPFHPLMAGLFMLKDSNPTLAEKLAEQVILNARITAGLVDDARPMVPAFNNLLTELMASYLSSSPKNN